jgi:CBS domain-containing protein
MLVKEVMHDPIVTIHAEVTLSEAAEQMLEHSVDGLPIVDAEQHVIGIIRLEDILNAPMLGLARAKVARSTEESNIARQLDVTPVRYVMAKRVPTIKEDDPLMAAVAIMVKDGLHPVPVLRDGRLVGVISRADAVRALLGFRLAPIVP